MPNGARARPNLRPDHNGPQRAQFESNKKKIYATQTVCGICGKEVNFRLKWPHPMSPCIDHIIPVAKGGHPSDINNLQLAHMSCNRQKSDKLTPTREVSTGIELVSNRVSFILSERLCVLSATGTCVLKKQAKRRHNRQKTIRMTTKSIAPLQRSDAWSDE